MANALLIIYSIHYLVSNDLGCEGGGSRTRDLCAFVPRHPRGLLLSGDAEAGRTGLGLGRSGHGPRHVGPGVGAVPGRRTANGRGSVRATGGGSSGLCALVPQHLVPYPI